MISVKSLALIVVALCIFRKYSLYDVMHDMRSPQF